MENNIYDVIIIGGGPAGLSASIYIKRSGLSTLIIENKMLGGLIVNTSKIENYPAGIYGESGFDFSMRLINQVEKFGIEHKIQNISKLVLDKEIKEVHIKNEGEPLVYLSKTIILATGTYPKTLGIKGESEFTGKGVSYCATCDGPLFKNENVFVVGGGDSALEESIHLSKYAKKVFILHRRDKLRAVQNLIEKVNSIDNIEVLYNTNLKEIRGEEKIDELVLQKNGAEEIYKVNENEKVGVFIFVGLKSNNELFKGFVDLDKEGFIKTNKDLMTNINGVFAAGDIREKDLRQLVTATADGALAADTAYKYLTYKD